MRERGGWMGALVGGVGILLSLLVLARGGSFFEVVYGLRWSVPLALVGVCAALAASRWGRGQANAVVWLVAVVLGGIGWNILVYSWEFRRSVFGVLVPLAHPTGIDFRDGLYAPGVSFSNAASGWPPLTVWLGKAFTAVSLSTGYGIQVGILLGFSVGAVFLCAMLARSAASSGGELNGELPVEARQLGLLGGLWLLTSYGIMFEIERGQIDLYALFFALLAVWLVLRPSIGSAWWPSLSLALAINLKAYPAVLAVIVLWRYRWRAIVPLLVTNVLLLLAAGPANVQRFIATQNRLESGTQSLGWVNHSAASLAFTLHRMDSSWPAWLGVGLLVLSAAVWVATLIVVMRRGWDDRRVVVVAAACVPVMCTFPSISNDYKLVLLVFPLVVLAAVTAAGRRVGGRLWAVLFMAVALEFFLLARSSQLVAPSLQDSKFVLILGLQVLLLIVGVLDARVTEVEAGRAGAGANGELGVLGTGASSEGPPMEAPT